MKNRSPDLLATDTNRVYLNPTGDYEGTDYINASWMTGELSPFSFSACQIAQCYTFGNRKKTSFLLPSF